MLFYQISKLITSLKISPLYTFVLSHLLFFMNKTCIQENNPQTYNTPVMSPPPPPPPPRNKSKPLMDKLYDFNLCLSDLCENNDRNGQSMGFIRNSLSETPELYQEDQKSTSANLEEAEFNVLRWPSTIQ